jgi:hypothetical protein
MPGRARLKIQALPGIQFVFSLIRTVGSGQIAIVLEPCTCMISHGSRCGDRECV